MLQLNDHQSPTKILTLAKLKIYFQLVGDPLLDAMGLGGGQSQLKVADGILTQVPQAVGGAAQADRRLSTYAREQDPTGYEAVCVRSNANRID